jgi:hypothetical protein
MRFAWRERVRRDADGPNFGRPRMAAAIDAAMTDPGDLLVAVT